MEESTRALEDSIRALITGRPEDAWILDNNPRGLNGKDGSPLRHPMLLVGADHGNDHTYFLSGVQAEAFGNVLFPLGHLEKGQASETPYNGAASPRSVRDIAHAERLPTAAKKDSSGICFVGECDG